MIIAKPARHCSECGKLIREHNKSGLCHYHAIRKYNKELLEKKKDKMKEPIQNKRLKCLECGFVKATNVFKDDRFYCRECGKNLGIRKLNSTQKTENRNNGRI